MNVGAVVGECASCGGCVAVVEQGAGRQPDLAQCDRCGVEVGVAKGKRDAEPAQDAPTGPVHVQDDIPF